VTTLRDRWSRPVVSLRRLLEPPNVVAFAVFVAILVSGIAVRLHYSAFLDPFEDGYQHWWISANLVATGEYWDRHSMMTQGNWLPLYHFFGAGVLGVAGIHNIAALKLANIVLSTLTAILVFFVLRRHGLLLALAGTAFFSFNFIDVVVSGWSTAESLATFLTFLGYAAIFHARGGGEAPLLLGSVALALAVMTRYEAWLVVVLLLVYVLASSRFRTERRRLLLGLIPAMSAMGAYFLYSLQWGFLPSIVVNQTSTDIRFQLSVGIQRSPGEILSQWWSGYIGFFPLLLALGGAHALLEIRREFSGWVLVAVWAGTIVYTVLRFGNPSFRYVLISVPFLSVVGALGAKRLIDAFAKSPRRPPIEARLAGRALALTVVVIAVTMLPSAATFWTPGFAASAFMVPLQRAGEFVSALPLPADKILLSESPIAAYFSGYAANRILGSRWLPDDRAAALTILKSEVAYVVYMGVPYYTLRILFPELESGMSTADFELLFDAGGRAFGTHTILVFRVLP